MNIPPPTAIIKTEFRYNPINKITAVTQPPEVRLNPCLVSQSIQLVKVTLNTQYLQAKPRRCSNRVALSYCLVESTLPRLMMLEPICLTPPGNSLNYFMIDVLEGDKMNVGYLHSIYHTKR